VQGNPRRRTSANKEAQAAEVWNGIVPQPMTNANLQMVPAGRNPASGAQNSIAASEDTGMAYSSMESNPAWPMIERLPVSLGVRVPLRGFTVRKLLGLRCGETVTSAWATTEDVPLQTGTLNVYWGEFEVVDQRIAIRLTRLA
jgi:flagellar motor switch protein FliN/FliY